VAFFLFTTYSYNIAMNTSASNEGHFSGIKKKIEAEAKEVFALTVYFAIWFCALAFLATTLNEKPILLSIFGIALIKAGLSAKFMLIGQAIVPIKVSKDYGILKSLFVESLIYLAIVLSLNYLEAGVHGAIHGKNFIDSMEGFGESNPMKVLAMCIVYWLIVWPYLIFTGMKLIMGKEKIKILFFGDRNQANN
jgi:hypothetical protein